METRRIALVTETFYPAVDGTTTTLKQVADHLIDAGHEVLVVAPGPGLATYRRSQVARIRPLDRPGRQVREALARFEPDLVHAVSPGTLGRKALKHARRLGVPTLVVQHTPLTELTREIWQAKVAARADRLVVTSDFLAGRLHQLDLDPAVWEPGRRHPRLHARSCATSGCTTSGRAPGPATAAGSSSGTPGACTSATAYGASSRSRTCPACSSW